MKPSKHSLFSVSSKGQAAVEFLTTYGWMFMIILVVFGGLAYFGLTDVKSNIPDSCTINKAFSCNAYVANETGFYAIEITNVDNKKINVTDMVCEFPFTQEQIAFGYDDVLFNPGETRVYMCFADTLSTSIADFEGKHLYKFKFAYTYDEPEPLTKVATGEFFTQVTDDYTLISSYQTAAQIPDSKQFYTPS